MPTIRKLSEDEVRKTVKSGESQRAKTAKEYDGYLADFAVKEYGEVGIDDATESKLTVKNRLKAAAARRGWSLSFVRTAGPRLRFQVRDQDEPSISEDVGILEAPESAEGTLADEPARTEVGRRRRKEPAAGA